MDTVVDLLAEAAHHDRRPALMIKPAFRTRRWRYRDLAHLAPRVAHPVVRAIGLGIQEVVFGEPMHFDAGTDATLATARLEGAVAAL